MSNFWEQLASKSIGGIGGIIFFGGIISALTVGLIGSSLRCRSAEETLRSTIEHETLLITENRKLTGLVNRLQTEIADTGSKLREQEAALKEKSRAIQAEATARQKTDQEKEVKRKAPAAMRTQLDSKLKAIPESKGVILKTATDTQIYLTIPGSIAYKQPGELTLLPGAAKILSAAADSLKQSGGQCEMTIIGIAPKQSAKPGQPKKSPAELGASYAGPMAKYLTEKCGLQKTKITTVGDKDLSEQPAGLISLIFDFSAAAGQ